MSTITADCVSTQTLLTVRQQPLRLSLFSTYLAEGSYLQLYAETDSQYCRVKTVDATYPSRREGVDL